MTYLVACGTDSLVIKAMPSLEDALEYYPSTSQHALGNKSERRVYAIDPSSQPNPGNRGSACLVPRSLSR